MSQDDMRYTTVVLPYQFGMKNGFINRDIVEQQFKENSESLEMLLAVTRCRLYQEIGIENLSNCWKLLKIIILQHSIERYKCECYESRKK